MSWRHSEGSKGHALCEVEYVRMEACLSLRHIPTEFVNLCNKLAGILISIPIYAETDRIFNHILLSNVKPNEKHNKNHNVYPNRKHIGNPNSKCIVYHNGNHNVEINN